MQYTVVPLERRNGLDGFQLKLIALIIMTIDHIYYFGSSLTDMPEIMTLIGRIAAPIFVFFVTEGFAHTHSRGRYLLRLYVCGVLMQFGNLLVNRFFPLPDGAIVINGIFTTMAVIVIYLWWFENMRKAWREHRRGCAVLYALAMAALFLTFLPISMLAQVSPLATRAAIIFVPSPIFCEGSVLIVLIGIGFYYCRNSKRAIAIFYTVFLCAVLALQCLFSFDWTVVLSVFFMWLALPFILLYNGERGRGMKYLFYIYYPAHVYILAIAASLLGRVW
ncbi:MAG TPA: conjugal transfer protein TraX [Candidatus Agathobaculum merdigallinarum]|nr:conjugal transfer protein TraX [Candidatus Agathobaculum merdigallinarum]